MFGNFWVALCTMLGCIAVFIAAVALVGRWLAATHPESAPVIRPAAVAPPQADELTPELLAVIAASVAVTYGPRATVTSVTLTPSVEALMLQWSLEGRRQIYTSHKVR